MGIQCEGHVQAIHLDDNTVDVLFDNRETHNIPCNYVFKAGGLPPIVIYTVDPTIHNEALKQAVQIFNNSTELKTLWNRCAENRRRYGIIYNKEMEGLQCVSSDMPKKRMGTAQTDVLPLGVPSRILKFRHYIQCNSLAQVGDFWAHEFLKEFENTLQNNPMLLYHPQHIISIQHLLETTGNEYIMDPKNDPHSASHSFGTACFQAIQILSNYKRRLQAMAMSYHPRLGSQSLLSLIPPDVMQTIHGMSLHP